jgi:glutamyl-Q tRNA(Asp) synthetase
VYDVTMAGSPHTRYRGRFAPSPTGPLHFGSLVAALGSWADARAHGGEWLVRMEDLDPPREVPRAADEILRTLAALGLESDRSVIRQSERRDAYRAALERLRGGGTLFACGCTRREIADSGLPGADGGLVYPGTCRNGAPPGRAARALRVRVGDATIAFDDALQGQVRQDLGHDVGDFVLLRADGFFAYQLAVVVDDADQGITDVVRGADLVDSTPRQIFLQRLLGLPTPRYLHFPIATSAAGEKLSKQTGAPAIDPARPAFALAGALRFLGQTPPVELDRAPVRTVLDWAAANWDRARLPRRRAIAVTP